MNKLIDQRSISTIRFLSADIVQKANSGHPGTPMGAATLAYTLWKTLSENTILPIQVGQTGIVLFFLRDMHPLSCILCFI